VASTVDLVLAGSSTLDALSHKELPRQKRLFGLQLFSPAWRLCLGRPGGSCRFIQPANQASDGDAKSFADAEQRSDSDWPSCLDLLPVPGGEAVGNHVFLRVTLTLPQLLNPLPEFSKEFRLVCHRPLCRLLRAKSPRAK